jgi:hypothetical protein
VVASQELFYMELIVMAIQSISVIRMLDSSCKTSYSQAVQNDNYNERGNVDEHEQRRKQGILGRINRLLSVHYSLSI